MISRTITLLAVLPVVVYSNSQLFCQDYLDCMQRLESKQRECLELEANYKIRSTSSCSVKKWDLKLKLNGLHLRRTELAKDCLANNMQDASLSESTLTTEKKTSCSSLHNKFVFAPRVPARKKRSTLKRNKRDAKKSSKLADCRTSTRAWHKHCSALALCCPLVEDCKISSKEVMEQIYNDRHKLQQLKDECEHR